MAKQTLNQRLRERERSYNQDALQGIVVVLFSNDVAWFNYFNYTSEFKSEALNVRETLPSPGSRDSLAAPDYKSVLFPSANPLNANKSTMWWYTPLLSRSDKTATSTIATNFRSANVLLRESGFSVAQVTIHWTHPAAASDEGGLVCVGFPGPQAVPGGSTDCRENYRHRNVVVSKVSFTYT